MNKILSIKLMIIIICVMLFVAFIQKGDTSIQISTEHFIKKHLTNSNGTLATYMRETTSEDEDSVKGKEALSETMGIWMNYALEKNDQPLFEESYYILKEYFMEADGFLYWKLTASGEREVEANALVDDLRIVGALFKAAEQWGDSRYRNTAIHISRFTVKKNTYKHTLTDFYEKAYGSTSKNITLSYIEPHVLGLLFNRQLLPEKTYNNMSAILREMPMDEGFYPKLYNVEKQTYEFDETINMVDQAFVAWNQVKSGNPTTNFLKFVKSEINNEGVIYGQYDLKTAEPVVKYESPALYGLLIMYAMEVGADETAKRLYNRMISFKSHSYKYKGGYSVYQKNTHIFDNIMPLLAERKMDNEGLIKK